MSEEFHVPKKPSETVDGYLTNKVQEARPGAVVYKVEDGENLFYVLREEGKEDISLGLVFKHAKQAIISLVKASKNLKKP